MPARRRLALFLALFVTVLASAALAEQDDPAMRSAGRKLAQDGVALLQQGKADEASSKLEKAYQLLQVPSVALWSARALVQRGLLVEASERYVEVSRLNNFTGDKEVQVAAQRDAAQELERLLPRIPSLILVVPSSTGEAVAVTLDGKQVPPALLGEEQPVNPGKHEIKVVRGEQQMVREITLSEGEKKRETLATEETASASPSPAAAATSAPASDTSPTRGGPRRVLAYTALAAGGVGLAVGGVTGVLAMGKRSSLEDSGQCSESACLPGQKSEVDALDTLRSVSTIGFIAGGVLAAAGVVLLLTDSPAANADQQASRLTLRLAPGVVSLSGSFQ